MEKECPVDFITVNENRVRLTALWVLLLVLSSFFVFANAFPVFIFLAIDFFLRAFNFGKFSPLNILSGAVVKQFKIPNKPIDQAPKRFAAGIGFVLSTVVVILLITELVKAAIVLAIVFAIFAFLESFLSFCAGCYVYTFLLKLKII
ncbi:MAG TPA: DUF4395 domain-containing protein [Ferruginibacter sp.]|jgi:hypothetical protein|nr:DUF4395 domain-containing protein [Ferruginibacter sp.]